MNPRCAAVIAEAAKRLGKSVNLHDMEAKIKDMTRGVMLKNPEAWRGMTKEQRMEQVGASLANEIQRQAAREATNAARNLSLAAKNMAYVDEAFNKEKNFMPMIRQVARYLDMNGSVQSRESRARAIAGESFAMLKPLVEIENAHLLFSDTKQTMQVVNEFHGIDTGNPDAKKAAAALRATLTHAAETQNQFGADISLRKDYLPQDQDMWRVRKSREAWIADATKHIDTSKTIDFDGKPLEGEALAKFLNEAWWNKATDGIGKKKGEQSQIGVNQSIANRHRAHRELHWKSPESWMYMNQKYGHGSLLDQVSAHIEKMSHETALMEMYGSNPLNAIDVLKQHTEEKIRAHGMTLSDKELGPYLKEVEKQRNRLDTMVDAFAGINQGITGNVGFHRFMSNIRSLNVFDKLGSIVTSQFADNGTAIATMRALRIPMNEWASMKSAGYTDKQMKRMAASNGVAFDVMLDNMLRLGDTADSTSIPGQLAKLTMAISGGNFFTKQHRMSVAAMIEKHTGDLTREFSWADLPDADKRIYASRGITERDWNIYRAATPDADTGLLGMKQIHELTTDQIKQFIPDEIANIEQLASDFRARMEAQNQKEAGWVEGRQTKFAEFKGRIQKTIDSYIATREKNKGELGDEMQARIDLLTARRNEADARLAAITGDVAEGVRLGSDVQKAIDATREAKMRLSRFENKADKQVFAKAAELEKRVDAQMKELDDFISKFYEKAKERNQWAKEYESKIGSKVEEAAELARRDASLKLTGLAIEEAETAVLQPGLWSRAIMPLRKGELPSELGASVLQFKTFAIAMWQQHMIQRAHMFEGKSSQSMYKLQVLALTSLFGGIGLMMADIAAGKDPRDVFDEKNPEKAIKFGMEAILKGGGLSAFGDLLNVLTTEGRRDPMQMLTGPTYGMASKGFVLGQELYQEGQDFVTGKNENKSKVAKKSLDLANEFVGLDSLIWTRAVYNNYLMAEMNELASPGYKSRMRQATAKNYGNEYWLGMGSNPRLPNLAAPIGQ